MNLLDLFDNFPQDFSVKEVSWIDSGYSEANIVAGKKDRLESVVDSLAATNDYDNW